MTESLLQLVGVTFRYPGATWHLEALDLHLAAGEFLGIVGPNGSGKSTVLKLAAGLLRPGAGTVSLAGAALTETPRRDVARRLGYLPQVVPVPPDRSAAEAVALGRYCRQRGLGFTDAADRAVIARCLALTDTEALAERSLSQLSGGERQRVLLAAVLAQEPEILLLDEPTTGLDLHHQVAFFRLLARFAAEGLAVAVVTHDWNLAAQFCERLLVLRAGAVVARGSVAEVVTAATLEALYGPDLRVCPHPANGRPVVLPLRAEDPA